jgi:hypothetical protein
MSVLGFVFAASLVFSPIERHTPANAAEGWLRFEFEKPPAPDFWEELSGRLSARPIEKVQWQVGLLSEWVGETRGEVIIVKVRGNCAVPATDVPWRKAPLGRVEIVNGEWLSYIHVDCKRIGEALRRVRGTNMAPAVVSVIRHELTHYMRRSMQHDEEGGFKAALCAQELLQASDVEPSVKWTIASGPQSPSNAPQTETSSAHPDREPLPAADTRQPR